MMDFFIRLYAALAVLCGLAFVPMLVTAFVVDDPSWVWPTLAVMSGICVSPIVIFLFYYVITGESPDVNSRFSR
jgi:hypothetical protein